VCSTVCVALYGWQACMCVCTNDTGVEFPASARIPVCTIFLYVLYSCMHYIPVCIIFLYVLYSCALGAIWPIQQLLYIALSAIELYRLLHRVGHNCVHTSFMNVCIAISLLKIPYTHHMCVSMYGFGHSYSCTFLRTGL
jgi:hypothetical protein